jgi:hypothetical protein
LLHALRQISAKHQISNERAEDACGDLAELALVRYRHQPG